MIKPSLFLIPLLVLGIVFLTGAWPASFVPLAQNPQADFVPQILTLECAGLSGEIDARQLLAKAMETLSAVRMRWLKTTIRQTMTDEESAFSAEGFLQRGPNHCARLEMQVVTDGVASRLLIVTDGEILAQERTIQDHPPQIVSEKLPPECPSAEEENLSREAYLAGKGCCGPVTLLEQLFPHLNEVKLQTGLLQGHPVIRLKGELQPGDYAPLAHTAIPVRNCYIYLDAKTLWPRRIEWWGHAKFRSSRCVMQIEFRDPVVNEELSVDECTRLFSYQPAVSTNAESHSR
jgi:hypothetical protein